MLWDWGGGTGSLGMLREPVLGTPPPPHGVVDEDPNHTPVQLALSVPHIHGALLLPSSLLFFQQVIILLLGMMS